ncbi:MAG: TIGR01777 family oxidoreductase [Cyclobacteriaceae bacterium]|nr:TIGR01777 family oxidoreductase [Cyclobacteriaceae bacterium]
MANVLITGATGLVGTRLAEILLEKGHRVAHVGRSKRAGPVPSFLWNVEHGVMEIEALRGIDAIVHLAGAGVADERWTTKRKKVILESRTKSSALLCKTLKNIPNSVKAVVSASAIGYYGFGLSDQLFTEESRPGTDYLANVVVQWEKEVDKIAELGIRVAKIRIGIVLSDKGGALKEMARPIRWGVGAPLGTGNQLLSWIHIDDLCRMFIKAVEDRQITGVYNGVGIKAITNQQMTKAIATVLNRPLLFPNIPAFILRLIVGEMADIVVNGSNVSSQKFQQAGFNFQFTDEVEALNDLFKR